MKIFYIVLYSIIALTSFIFAELPNSPTLKISNEFISVIVNNQDAIGRFAIETTNGNPDQVEDDNRSLIYGRPIPWTSYTTILINDVPYIFGNPDKRLARRLAKTFQFGTFLYQHYTEEAIITAFSFEDIQVKQTLTFYRNPNTNLKDSALIRYDISNYSDFVTANVGIRIMLDTKLGQNDGSPLRMGPEAVTEEKLYPKETLFDYWMTFDSLVSPNIVAQGLLKDPSSELTVPDKLYLANWGTLVEEPWEINYEAGRSFIRKGEEEKDTALGIYYEQRVIAPQSETHVQTVYGLGGLSLSPGKLAVGLSMPQELPAGFPDTFLIQGYVLNTGSYQSHDTSIEFKLGHHIIPIENNLISTLNILDAGQQQQIPLVAKLSKNARSGKVPIQLTVSSSTYESNSLTRNLTIIPRLTLDFSVDPILPIDYDEQKQAIISSYIQNNTNKKITKINTMLRLPNGLSFPEYENPNKYIPILEPGQSIPLHWMITIHDFQNKYDLTFNTSSAYTLPKDYFETLYLSEQKGYELITSKTNIATHDRFFLRLNSHHIDIVEPVNIRFEYDPSKIKAERVSSQSATRLRLQETESIVFSDNAVELIGITAKQDSNTLIRLAKIHFKALKAGPTEVLVYINGTFLFTYPLNIDD